MAGSTATHTHLHRFVCLCVSLCRNSQGSHIIQSVCTICVFNSNLCRKRKSDLKGFSLGFGWRCCSVRCYELAQMPRRVYRENKRYRQDFQSIQYTVSVCLVLIQNFIDYLGECGQFKQKYFRLFVFIFHPND